MHGIRFNRARNRCGAVIPICLIGLLSDWKKPQTHRLRCVTPRRNVPWDLLNQGLGDDA